MRAPDTKLLMRRVAQRDVAAFESVYETHHRMVFGIGLRLLGDAAAAEDFTRSLFLDVWANAAAFQGGSLAGWFSRVARNGALDVLRRRSALAAAHIAAAVPLDGMCESTVGAGIDSARVQGALAQLPPDERALIELGYFGGMTYHRIASETGLPPAMVKTRIRAGLHRLRAALDERFSAPPRALRANAIAAQSAEHGSDS